MLQVFPLLLLQVSLWELLQALLSAALQAPLWALLQALLLAAQLVLLLAPGLALQQEFLALPEVLLVPQQPALRTLLLPVRFSPLCILLLHFRTE